MKLSYKLTILSAVMALSLSALAVTAHAEDADVNVSVTATVSPTPSPLPPGGRGPAGIRANIENRLEQNKDTRNALLEKRVEVRKELASTTAQMRDIRKDMHDDIKDMRMDFKEGIKMLRASTTEMFKENKDARKAMAKQMQAQLFNMRKAALTEQLEVALNNLTNISLRIDARITKAEGEGRTVTDAKALLVTANAKIADAKTAVAAFKALPDQVASTTVDLVRPRQLGDAAIKSVKDARGALQKVVEAIAHDMGLRVGLTATSTPPVHDNDNDDDHGTTTSH
jgi:hypothetical protein